MKNIGNVMTNAPNAKSEIHKNLIGSFINNKLQEYKYYFIKIITLCNLVNENYKASINPVNTSNENINYLFNALANHFQTLKDSLQVATGQQISWSMLFDSIRHAQFVKDCRNAIAHDGMEVINAYIDGKYYIANDIKRFDKNKLIHIAAPVEDILTLITEFTYDLMVKIEEIVKNSDAFFELYPTLKVEDILAVAKSPVLPDFAKMEILKNIKNIESMLVNNRINVQKLILNETSEIKNLCH
jgi:hypothetical protein